RRPAPSHEIKETGTPEQKATGMPVCQQCRDSSVKHVATHDTRLEVANQTTDFLGQLAYSTGVPLNELSLKRASLEDAFMELTGDSVQYHGSTGAQTTGTATPLARPTQQEV
ncbi:hypothetical protein RAE05_11280, partial [Corynebacterium tuberculostearicum]|nr:hypothetical protein [Corynebacterium tuberculostearicum]